MTEHYNVLQRFGRREAQAIYLIGSPELLKHEGESAEPVEVWNEKAIERGVANHPKGQCGRNGVSNDVTLGGILAIQIEFANVHFWATTAHRGRP